MADIDLTDDLMGELFNDKFDDLMVVKLVAPDDDIARAMRVMDREIKTSISRPSNDHPRSPRCRK